MRTTVFLNERSTITADRETLTLDISEGLRDLLGEVTLHLGSRPAVVAVVTDKLIDQLQELQKWAVKKALDEGTATFPRPKVVDDGIGHDYDSPAGAGHSVEADRE